MTGRRTGRLLVVLGLASAAAWPAVSATGGGGCHGPTTEGTGDTVAMVMACFGPSVLRVDPGAEVRFVNKDAMTHNVSAAGWGSEGDLGEGDGFTATFDEEGTFPYACMYHYGMTGAIVVGDGAGPASGKTIGVDTIDQTPVAAADAIATEPSEKSRALGWAIAGGTGLLVGAGVTGLIRRRRVRA
ncbi:MAG: cupredoxin domain-containing protein [Actinomycetota bacterium]